jgi:small subunit ribosomal protein S16
MGAKKKPFYRVVVADSRSPRDGRFIEELGWCDPLKDPAEIKIDVEAARKWIGNGAQPTDTARALLKKAGVYDAPSDEESAEGGEVAPAEVVDATAAAPAATEEAVQPEAPAETIAVEAASDSADASGEVGAPANAEDE